jgi:23S rRNA (pseudouridine1915-N3)-methyltransferase
LKIFVYFAGKPKGPHANALAAEYLKRAGRYVKCEMREVKPDRARWWEDHPRAGKVLLDAAGAMVDSAGFVRLIQEHEAAGRDLVFVVGGADGLPEEWKRRAGMLLSLSPMTLPHELARVLLAEQIYRAYAAMRGHPYPR